MRDLDKPIYPFVVEEITQVPLAISGLPRIEGRGNSHKGLHRLLSAATLEKVFEPAQKIFEKWWRKCRDCWAESHYCERATA